MAQSSPRRLTVCFVLYEMRFADKASGSNKKMNEHTEHRSTSCI